MSTKTSLLSKPGRRERVMVDGETVTLQAPRGGPWLEYQARLAALPAESLDHLIMAVALTAIDEEGKPLLTEQDCRELDHQTLITLARAAMELMKTTSEVAPKQGES